MENEQIVEAPASTETSAPAAPVIQPMPDRAPPEGCRFVLDPKTGVYNVVRIPDAEGKPGEPASAVDEPKAADAEPLKGVLELPITAPSAVQHSPLAQEQLGELASIAHESGIPVGNVQDMVDLAYEIHAAFDDGSGPADLHDEMAAERVRGQMRREWDQVRWDAMKKGYDALPEKAKAFFERTGLGNSRAICELLAEEGVGQLETLRRQTPENRQKIVDFWRARPEIRDSMHKDHKLAVTRLRVAAYFAAKGQAGEEPSMKRLKDALEEREAAKTRKGDSPEAKLDSELQTLRMSPAYFDKSRPEHKAVVERVREIYRLKYPG